MRARRLPGCAASRSPRRAALRFLRLTPEWPRLPPARLAGEPADSAPLSPAPAPRSHPAPRPGHARWSTRASEPGGAVPAGKWGRGREGRPSPWPLDSCVARPPGPGSRFTDEETEGWRGCAPVEGEAHCLRSHSIQAREHPLLVSQRRKLGFREEKPLVRGHSAPGWVPSSASSPSSRCTEISRLLLGRTSGLPPTPCSNPLSRSRPRPCECRDKSDGRVCVGSTADSPTTGHPS